MADPKLKVTKEQHLRNNVTRAWHELRQGLVFPLRKSTFNYYAFYCTLVQVPLLDQLQTLRHADPVRLLYFTPWAALL